MDEALLKKTVNSSGFPLQIALEALVKDTYREHRWRVLFSEHSWANYNTEESGFIDLILQHADRGILLVVECKRVQNSSWIFLYGEAKANTRTHAKAWCTQEKGGKLHKFGWFDATVDPSTAESRFCVVPGQDAKSRPMLERLAAEVVASTEGFAIEDQSFHKGSSEYERWYFSAIVSTADLLLCNFDPAKVPVGTGEVDEAKFTRVPYLRFRKQLSTYEMPEASWKESTATEIATHKENTVFVINANALIDFLRAFCD
ncbi:hypothetical protein ACFL0Q_00590 [Thermodesulfobacteriota bacterium]